jgi:exodeoxyribonuclease-3
VKIATFNINGVNKRLTNLLDWLQQAAPDAVCLQEIKCRNAEFPRDALANAGYGAIWHGQGPHHGVAILMRDGEPIETRRSLPGALQDREARYLEAAVNGVLIGCLYLPNGNPQPGPKFDYKLAWFARLLMYAAELDAAGVPVVLAGDYNVVPTDADIYNMRSWKNNALVQPEPRALFAQLVARGWTDALRTLHPAEPIYTFWQYLRNAWERDAGMRLDHVLLNNAVATRLESGGVDRWVRGRENASDHAPAWVTLRKGDRPSGH